MPQPLMLGREAATSTPEAPTDGAPRLGELLGSLGPGRLEALDEIWSVCAKDLYGLALWRTGSAADAEDVLQEVFVRIVGAAERGQLRKIRRPMAYLLRIAHTAAIDLVRSRGRHRGEKIEDQVLFVESDPARRAEANRLSQHLAELPDSQRAVVFLRHFRGLSFREISSVMGIPTFTAASRHRLALSRLRKKLGVES